MLNLWRKAWRGSQQASQPSAQAASTDTPSLHDNPTPISTTSWQAELGSSSVKRPFEESNLPEGVAHSRPTKKIRTNGSDATDDSLATHLPEIVDASESSTSLLSVAIEPHEVLHHVQSKNTPINILTAFLPWAISSGGHNTATHRGAVFLVADNLPVLNTYIEKLSDRLPRLRVGRFIRDGRAPELPAWASMLKSDVVVTLTQSLLEGLEHGIFTMADIFSIVIIDAQYLKDQDSQTPLAILRVIEKFYHTCESSYRPRLLITATLPLAHWSAYDGGMLRLESIFDAKVFGITDERRIEIASLPDRPNEVVVLYEGVKSPIETKLYKQLHQLDPSEIVFRRYFKASRYVLWDLGPCGSDLVWRRALSDIKSSVAPWDDDVDEGPGGSIAQVKARISNVVANWEFTMPNLDLSSRGFNVTHKFLRLVQTLKSCKTYGEAFRGIIFVRRRITAFIMMDLLRMLDEHIGFIRPCTLAGPQISNDSQRQEVIRSFAAGTFNLVIATKSAEDIEIPRTLIAIRFDIFDSEVSLTYTKARTRGRESHVVHMVERNNDTHRRIVSQSADLGLDMLRWNEVVFNSPLSAVPPRPLRETPDPYFSDSEDEGSGEYIQDPVTSGRILPQNATTVIYRHIASASNPTTTPLAPLFRFRELPGKGPGFTQFICDVLLPIGPISGAPARSMALARRSACYAACLELVSSGVLDYRYFYLAQRPTYSTSTESTRPSGYSGYTKKQPDFWDNATPPTKPGPRTLYPLLATIDHTTDIGHQYAPILLLTWKSLPALPDTRLFFSGMPSSTRFQRGHSITITEEQLQILCKYTIRVIRSISNKPYDCRIADMFYFVAPVHRSVALAPTNQLLAMAELIDWDIVRRAGESWAVPLAYEALMTLSQDTEDAVVQDRWVEFTRRYDVVRVRPDLRPLSKPEDSPREARYNSLLHFCQHRRIGFEGLKDYEQPIIEVSKCSSCFNHLNPTTLALTPSSKVPAKYLIPELCAKFTIPASIFRTALLLPCLASRIDDLLLVKELNTKLFDNVIADSLLYMAICAPSAGMEHDYERLELLGDAFLKYLSSVYVFVTKPSDSEGAMHMIRQKIISNKTLFHAAIRVGLPQYIQSKPLSIKMWHPPNFYVVASHTKQINEEGRPRVEQDTEKRSGSIGLPQWDPTVDTGRTEHKPDLEKDKNEATESKGKRKSKKKRTIDPNTQWLGEKAIADVAEAIIGAAYVSGGRDAGLKVAKALKVPIYDIDQWSDFGRKVLAPPPMITAKLPSGTIGAVESIIGHQFNYPHLLAQALTHTSYPGIDTTTYERFEFIGDAILDFMVIRYIFDREDKLSPGGLTLLKGAMVSNAALAAICVWSGLHDHLLFDSQHLANSIQAYATQVQSKQAEEYAAAAKEGRSPGQYWLEIEPPKAFESIIGAVYISDNFSPVGAEAIFDKLLRPFYGKHITLKSLSHHPTKSLFELFQAQGCQCFEILKEKVGTDLTRCSVLVHDVVLAVAEDAAPHTAARLGSLFALDALEGDPSFLARSCDCRTRPQPKKNRQNELEAILAGLEDSVQKEQPESAGS
ncbi:hypothetical protein AX16_010288 [Volvariella volvacea WC 439]|nr:hypothetical protein AX16_010288 [Volvariella volvacea WC 439]